MKRLLVVLFGVLGVSVGSAQADWIKHEDHGAKGRSAGVARIFFNQVKHSDLDDFVKACKTQCVDNSDTCGGFILEYAPGDKSKPKYCTFKKEDFTLVEKPTKDFYQVVTHEEILALLEPLLANLDSENDTEWLTDTLIGAGFTISVDTPSGTSVDTPPATGSSPSTTGEMTAGQDAVACNDGDPYTQACADAGKSVCWKRGVGFPANTSPWVVGHPAQYDSELRECRVGCAVNDTCYQDRWWHTIRMSEIAPYCASTCGWKCWNQSWAYPRMFRFPHFSRCSN